MRKKIFALLFVATSIFANETKEMIVYKSPYCGCCESWIKIMKDKGFEVKAINTNNIDEIKAKAGLKPSQTSCHTAFIDGYVIEGHVDYSAVKKMLSEKPDIVGISVPGMPLGSPGMEQGNIKHRYNVISINRDGSQSIYEKH